MDYVWAGVAGGAASFAHCLGMCGGFALHLSGGASKAAVLLRQSLWHAARTFSYVFLGAMAGFLGERVGAVQRWSWLQDALAYAMGAVMVLMGLKILGLLPWRIRAAGQEPRRAGRTQVPGGLLSGILGPLLGRPTAGGAFALGLATGFLPCPVVVFFLALSVQGRSVPTGMLTMAALGVGTVWSLALLGAAGGAARRLLRRWGPRLAGTVLVVLGLATTLRGTETFHRFLGCPGEGTSPAAMRQPVDANEHGGCCTGTPLP